MPMATIEDLREGMALAEDVLDGNGQPMLRAGTELTDRDIRRFRMWGIMEIAIQGEEGEDDTAASQLTPDQLAAAEPIVQELFRHTKTDHPFIKLLYDEQMRRTARECEAPTHAGA